MCSRPRKPTRKPKPSATEVSGSHTNDGSLTVQLIERVTQVLVVLVIDREQARIDHGLGLAVAGKRLGAGIRRPREGIAHAHGSGSFGP